MPLLNSYTSSSDTRPRPTAPDAPADPGAAPHGPPPPPPDARPWDRAAEDHLTPPARRGTDLPAPPATPAPPASPAWASRRKIRQGLAAVGWTVVFLALIDVALNKAFPYPQDPNRQPSSLQAYFEYGRTIEGKLPRLVGPTDATSALVSTAGWLKDNPALTIPSHEPAKRNIRVYGMSFSDHVARAAARLDPTLAVSTFDGPAAPPNHSFAGYMLEREQLDADVVVFGILASSVPKLPTLTMMTSTYEAPCVYTYPRYRLAGDELQATWPTVVSLADLRAARNDPAKWNAYVNELAANDAYYAPYLLRSTWLDHSALARIAWRALAQRHLRTVGERYHTAAGYTDDPDLLPVLRQMVATFAKTAREDGRTPVVLLFNDRGYGDDLYRGVAPVLDRDHIPYVSSHTIAPATDHQNFVADGHFTPANDEKIAKAFVDLLHTLPVPPAHR